MRGSVSAVAIAVVATVAVAAAFAQGDAEPAGSGPGLYRSFQCWQCHGYEGQGGVGPRLAGTEYPFEAFVRLVRHTTLMPAYSPNVLADDELRLIWEFVRSRPTPPPLEDIPALEAY